MPLIDFYEVRDFQVRASQETLNVYHYENLGSGGPAVNIGQAFIDTVLPVLRPLQPASLQRTFLEVQNLGSPFDFATIDTSGLPGTRAGSSLATFVAATIQLNRTRTDIKNGMKRFSCGVEADIGANQWEAAFLTSLTGLADILVVPLELSGSPGISRAQLVVLKRFCTTAPSPPCAGVYRLPNTDAEIDGNNYVPISATRRAKVRSHVSRKELV